MDLAIDDETGDLGLLGGDLFMVNGVDAVVQFLRNEFRFFLAEWFLDESRGVPYHDDIFVKNPKAVVIDNIFKNMILSSPGISELIAFDSTLDGPNRKLFLTFRARAFDGTIIDFSEPLTPSAENHLQIETGEDLQTEDGSPLEIG